SSDADHPEAAGVGDRGGERRRRRATHAGLLQRQRAADELREAVHGAGAALDTAVCIAARYLPVARCCSVLEIGGQTRAAHIRGRDTARMSNVMLKSAPRVMVNDSSPSSRCADSLPDVKTDWVR